MKIRLIIFLEFLSILSSFGQVKKCCDTYVYEGYIQTEQNKKIEINLNFLLLLDSTIVGSYYYEPNSGTLKLIGKLNPDYTFNLVERNKADNITGFFEGILNTDFKLATGKWKDAKSKTLFDFEIKQVLGKSYWDYIKYNRTLFEYKNLRKAIKNRHDVLSIDVASQQLKKLPNKLSRLDRIVSISLLGNEFKSFPTVLTKLTTLNEISLSSNQLQKISSKIGQLQNLRILILNNNQLKQLPKEIGELTNLLYLEVGNNQLVSLPEEIKYLTNLQELHIEGNQVSELEKQNIQKLLPKCVIYF